MPYEYRKLTQKEREELVAHRIAMGFPPHAPPHPFRDSACYMFTAANFEHAHVMESADRRSDFQTRLLRAFQEIEAEISVWVILANHYHVLARVESLLNYIHYNPAKHGYVESAYDWKWSSLGMYQEDHGREWLREKWTDFPPQKEYGEGWDEM